MSRYLALWSLLVVLSFAASPVAAEQAAPTASQLSTLFKVDDNDPEAHVPTAQQRTGNPLEFGYFLQDLLTKAEIALKRDDHAGAIKYYRGLAAAIPEEAQGWSKLCEQYEATHDPERAIRACRYAIDRTGVELKDYQRYVSLLVTRPADLNAEEQGDLKKVLQHLETQPGMAIPAAHLGCQAAVRTKDKAALQACTGVLAKAAPDDPKTIVFQWTLAVMNGDRDAAARLVDRAKTAGVAGESIQRMSSVAGMHWWTSPSPRLVVLAGGAVLLALLFLAFHRRRLAASTRRLAP
jgi:hypothetical protein